MIKINLYFRYFNSLLYFDESDENFGPNATITNQVRIQLFKTNMNITSLSSNQLFFSFYHYIVRVGRVFLQSALQTV